MEPCTYETAAGLAAAAGRLTASSKVLAGGTTLVDLMKLDVERPTRLVDINAAAGSQDVAMDGQVLRLGALVRMATAAEHPLLEGFPALRDALLLAASPQIRQMASLGGNLLQRTRCAYFREAGYRCNKRTPGAGCDALEGVNRLHAVLGTSEHCIASYPGDWAVALVALEAELELVSPAGARRLPVALLHRAPGDRPDLETTLAPDELIAAIRVAPSDLAASSVYVKARDRESYAFANASAAAALVMDGHVVRDVRLALGGVATKPWRALASEASLRGRAFDEAAAVRAGEIAFAESSTTPHNAFKVPLGAAVVTKALLQARARS